MSASNPSRNAAVAPIVERQMRNWELARSQRVSVHTAQRREVEDFIAISRRVGSGGSAVAELLAEKLKWPLFDRKILDEMAGDDDLRRRIYASMDERDMGWMEESLRSMMQPEFSRNDYFRRLTKTVLSLARQGSAVFLGRGADLILPAGVGFRVRLVAPVEVCVQAYAARLGMDVHRAGAEVRRLERHRTQFIQNHFGVDPSDPIRYDLVINVARFTAPQAVDLILHGRKLAPHVR